MKNIFEQLSWSLWEFITLEFMIKFFISYFLLVWIILIAWVAKDISSRTENIFYRVFCTLLVIVFSPLWVLLYLLIRPRKSMQEVFLKEIEDNLGILTEIVQERLEHNSMNQLQCPHCNCDIEEDFTLCPECKKSLKYTCKDCHKEIRQDWKVCPYCQTKQKKKKKK